MEPLINNACRADLESIMNIETENFGPDAFNRSQFLYALKNERAVFIKASAPPGNAFKGVLGYAMGFVRTAGKTGRARSARLYSIAVARRAQGMSIGRKLLAEFERLMVRKNCSKIYLEVRTDNAAAIKLYESCGYARAGLIENYYHDSSPAFKYVKKSL